MNIDRELVNRALEKAGQEPLVDEDITKNTARWRLVKSFYLATILETLAHTSWTSMKRRAKLEPYDGDNYSNYAFVYRLPLDCAKPEELTDKGEYLTEGRFLYTDSDNAVLVYITDGYKKERYEMPDEQPTAENFAEKNYYYLDDEDGEYKTAQSYVEGTVYFIFSTDDFPAYEQLEFDAMLKQYIETRLASKIVLKITGKTDLYQLLFNEALMVEQKAVSTTYAHNRNKAQGNKFWAEQLGLTD